MDWLDNVLISRKRQKLSRADSLGAKPVRNPAVQWELVDGKTGEEVLLTVPPPKSAWLPLLRIVAVVPNKERRILLDEIGSFVWKRCDGETSVQEMCDALCGHYRLSYREGLVSLTTYLRQLGRRSLVAFAMERHEDAESGEAPAEKTQEADNARKKHTSTS